MMPTMAERANSVGTIKIPGTIPRRKKTSSVILAQFLPAEILNIKKTIKAEVMIRTHATNIRGL